jgi:uncharacterized protein (DUF3084 family)
MSRRSRVLVVVSSGPDASGLRHLPAFSDGQARVVAPPAQLSRTRRPTDNDGDKRQAAQRASRVTPAVALRALRLRA